MLSKTKVREIISAAFKDENAQVSVKEVLALFASAKKGGETKTTVLDADGNLVGKLCSLYNVWLPISEFRLVSGKPVPMCKHAESYKRKSETAAKAEKAKLDAAMAEGTISVEEWKLSCAALNHKEDMVLPENCFDSAEELLASL